MFERTEHPAADQNRELRNQASSSLCNGSSTTSNDLLKVTWSGAMRQPVAETKYLGVRLNSEEPKLCGDSSEKRSTRPTAWEHGQDMWIAEQGCRCKIPPVTR